LVLDARSKNHKQIVEDAEVDVVDEDAEKEVVDAEKEVVDAEVDAEADEDGKEH